MVKVLTSILLLALLGNSGVRSGCQCQPATEEDEPHGANAFVTFTGKTVREIHGIVRYFSDNESIEDVVVEVYDINSADNTSELWQLVEQRKRRAACLTGKDGKFCFKDLPSGKYLLRAGTRARDGLNMAHMEVRVDRRWGISWLRSNKDIQLELTPGT